MRTWSEITGKDRSSYDSCPHCEGPKARHARACQKCSSHIMRGENHYAWKGDAATATVKRSRVANARVWGPCEVCGAKGIDRHHRDGDPGNNIPENLQVLCRRCHMQADGRLAAFAALSPEPKPPSPCVICGRPSKPLRKGRCHACNEYLRRNGVERTVFRCVNPEEAWIADLRRSVPESANQNEAPR